MVRGTISDYIPNPTFEVVARPGAQEEYFRIGNPEGKSYRQIVGDPMRAIPAFRSPRPRLELMDEQGVDRTLMFPTLASLLEERMRDDLDMMHAVVHALNEWLYEEWTFNYEDRIFTTPIITLPIVDKAIEELEWVLERGAKTILIRPAPVPGYRGSRSFGFEEFDPFWQRVSDAGILVSMHASDSGYARYQGEWTGPEEMLPFRLDPFRLLTVKERPIFDTMAAFTCHGVLHQVPFVAGGLCRERRRLDPGLHRSPLGRVPEDAARRSRRDPIEAFKRNVYVSPFHEDDIVAVDRHHGRRPHPVRFGLPAPRGPGRAVQLPRAPAGRHGGRRHRQDHGRQPRCAHGGRGTRRLTP